MAYLPLEALHRWCVCMVAQLHGH